MVFDPVHRCVSLPFALPLTLALALALAFILTLTLFLSSFASQSIEWTYQPFVAEHKRVQEDFIDVRYLYTNNKIEP